MKALSVAVILSATLLMLSGCYSDNNNYLTPKEFPLRLEEAGIKVTSVRDIPGAPFKATSGNCGHGGKLRDRGLQIRPHLKSSG